MPNYSHDLLLARAKELHLDITRKDFPIVVRQYGKDGAALEAASMAAEGFNKSLEEITATECYSCLANLESDLEEMFGEPDEKDLVEEDESDDADNVSAEQDEPDCEEMEADGCDPTDEDDRWQQERDYAATHDTDVSYVSFFKKGSPWYTQIDKAAAVFFAKWNKWPNALVMSQKTADYFADQLLEQKNSFDTEEAFQEFLALHGGADMPNDDSSSSGVRDDSDIGNTFGGHAWKYHLTDSEETDHTMSQFLTQEFADGVFELACYHAPLVDDEDMPCPEIRFKKLTPLAKRDAHPVIDMEATGKNIERLMKEENISVALLQRIFNFSTPQGIYKWFWGQTLPNMDNMTVLSRVLNRSIDEILVTKNRKD
jgi:hypothetical protein